MGIGAAFKFLESVGVRKATNWESVKKARNARK